MRNGKKKSSSIWDRILQVGTIILLGVTFVILAHAMYGDRMEGEAPTGSFQAEDFNEGWQLIEGDAVRPVEVPSRIERREGEEIVLVNTLPSGLGDGMSLMIRSSMEDVLIYVDGKLRADYSSESIENMSFYIPSAYVVAELNSEDSGKEIVVRIRVKTKGVINGIRLSHGNNVWFEVIKSGLPVCFVAHLVLILGLVLLAAVLVLGRSYRVAAPRQLSLLMINTAVWVFSESTLRQLFFRNPSLSQYFSYLTVEMIAIFAIAYFDEVQHRVYHKRYLIVELAAFFQIVLNIFMHFSGILPFYRSLPISHIISAVAAIVSIVSIITDFVKGRTKEYKITAIGILCFVGMSLVELIGFYVNRFHVFGTSICIALILLMAATVIQTIFDEVMAGRARHAARARMTTNTIETIASAIDARDEGTGGHSDRVSLYAGILAEAMAEKYHLTQEDILRIRYIGLVHDIGKIGIAENVLNNPGKFTEEEFGLMKKHVEIGYGLMSAMGESVPGILDGIRYHHERYNGSGYPDGLSGANIPLVARILALADSYDAMTSNRVYRKILTQAEVRAEILSCSGKQFDPALVKIFIRLLDEGKLDPGTAEGLNVDQNGMTLKSKLLEERLQKDLKENRAVGEPSHVRMLCYCMKLMERGGKGYRVFFMNCGDSAEEMEMLRSVLRMKMTEHDINLQYTENENLVALYDYSGDQVDQFLESVRGKCPSMRAEEL